jgi:hypothetical protein
MIDMPAPPACRTPISRAGALEMPLNVPLCLRPSHPTDGSDAFLVTCKHAVESGLAPKTIYRWVATAEGAQRGQPILIVAAADQTENTSATPTPNRIHASYPASLVSYRSFPRALVRGRITLSRHFRASESKCNSGVTRPGFFTSSKLGACCCCCCCCCCCLPACCCCLLQEPVCARALRIRSEV